MGVCDISEWPQSHRGKILEHYAQGIGSASKGVGIRSRRKQDDVRLDPVHAAQRLVAAEGQDMETGRFPGKEEGANVAGKAEHTENHVYACGLQTSTDRTTSTRGVML